MTLTQWFIFFLITQVVHFLGTWKLYEKAGRKGWEAAIPVYNAIVLMKIIDRPTWWTVLLFIPIVNLIMFPVIWVETLRAFGKKTPVDTILGVATLGFYIYYINYAENVTHIPNKNAVKTDNTLSSLLFAVVVATLVHTYVMQPFTIPTSSLEKSLLVGDFLFVSKFHYGARTPMTAVAAPMVHDSIPFAGVKSYSTFPQLPYFRFPGVQDIERNDIVVFNWPIDTVYQFRDGLHRTTWKPIDKRSNYVKRCVGVPGDKLEIKNGDVYINNNILVLPERAQPQFSYSAKIDTKATANVDYNAEFLKLNTYDRFQYNPIDSILYFPALTAENAAKLKAIEGVIETRKLIDTAKTSTYASYIFKLDPNVKDPELEHIISRLKEQKHNVTLREDHILFVDYIPKEFADVIKKQKSVLGTKEMVEIFPHADGQKNWTKDNLGPISIPKQGQTVTLNAETLPFYRRIISEYEHNDLKVTGTDIRINGQVATSYTFKQDYYWMMGDNRHNSEDSRYWGFVPADHIVGKPVFVWMSLDPNIPWSKAIDKIRWERLFTTVGGDGQPVSYFLYFFIAMVAYGTYAFIKNRKAKRAR